MTDEELKELGMHLDTPEGRAEFIAKAEEDIYTGITLDGREARVHLGETGMSIYFEQKGKPNWWEIIDYDKNGLRESVRYEARG